MVDFDLENTEERSGLEDCHIVKGYDLPMGAFSDKTHAHWLHHI